MPLGFILWHVQEVAGKSYIRHALAGAMYLILVHYSRGKKADREVDYGFIRRVQKAEDEQTARHVHRSEAVENGERANHLEGLDASR
ncbi:hypothetical protein [Ensifer sp. BR816]|uniref:hypothetical protein n=1 Tax=Rhizobium sp. (strain BR816) TaxID=1057002 RepID=UPI000372A6AB|nr:hypothetical protein [Ensifer sp. BR816]